MTTPTENVVAEWRAAMEGVTPGPWEQNRRFEVGRVISSDDQSDGMTDVFVDVFGNGKKEDAAWIARCSPSGISALLALIESPRSRAW